MRQREGFFFTPKHSTEKFFRKFFQNYPKRLFADFLARICDEGNGCLLLAIGGGLFLWACRLVAGFASFLFSLSLVAPAVQGFPSRSLVGLPCLWWCWLAHSLRPAFLPLVLVGFRSLLVGTIGAAGPVVFLVSLGGAGLRCLAWIYRGGSGLWEHLKQGKTAQNRLKRGKN